jgi:L-aminopeptidase/D-esterase-like protein
MKESKTDKFVEFYFKDVYISQVQYPTTGMTSIYSPKNMTFYIDKRGKDIVDFSLVRDFGEGLRGTKAVCFVGSSSLGIEGICGFNRALLEDNLAHGKIYHDRAIGACVYSWNLKHDKDYSYFPDIKLGKYAFKHMSQKAYIGEAGCGVNARVGKRWNDSSKRAVPAGQGAAYLEIGKMKCLCITILNSVGVIHENGKLLHDFQIGKHKIKDIKDIEKAGNIEKTLDLRGDKKLSGNTTLTVFVTNVKLEEEEMKEYSKLLHDVVESMVYPYATRWDGDTFIMLSCNEIQSSKEYIEEYQEVVRKAIRSVFE